MTAYLKQIAEAVQNGNDHLVTSLVAEALQAGVAPQEIMNDGLIPGIQELGQLFKEGEAYLPEILISSRAMKRGIEILRPHLSQLEMSANGTVVIGTVEGDMHDIGKNLVKLMLESNGFQVYDLGVDVSAESFLQAAKEESVDIIAMSVLLTTTMPGIAKTVRALQEAHIRDKVKIMIGGAPLSRQFADAVGVEGYADDCASAVDEAKRLMDLA